MSRVADLHIHTFYSDSTSSPQEVVLQAKESQIDCIAITDHDTIDGILPTIDCARQYDIEIISGIELSAQIQGKDVHILGYFFDINNEKLLKHIKHFQQVRLERMKEMINKLQSFDIPITYEDVLEQTSAKSLGRPHLAQILVSKKVVPSLGKAFDKYLAEGAKAYVPKFQQSPHDAIDLIHQAGGLAVLAHPMITKIDQHINELAEIGLDGIEVFYPNCSTAVQSSYEKIADKYGLLKTGGSDAHGDAKKHTYIGKQTIDYVYVEHMKEAISRE